MIFLMELTGRAIGTGDLRTFRFTDRDGGHNTRPTDVPANAHYAPRVVNAGNYSRSLFGGQGRTNGQAEVDRGVATLANFDGGLDEMLDYAFDGYELAIWSLADRDAPHASRLPVMTGTIEQVEVTWEEVRLRLRSRLASLDKPLQEETYKGTTITGNMDEAEGGADLKDAPRLLGWGRPRNAPALTLNRFHQIHGIAYRFDTIASLRSRGTVIPFSGQDFASIAALRTAVIQDGRFATAKALGLLRVGGNATQDGRLTVDFVEGATAADRTAGQIVRRILRDRAGLVENVDFLLSDIAALDAEAPHEVGYWAGTSSVTILAAVSTILDSVGAYISPDKVGVFRIGRFRAPVGPPVRTFTEIEIVEDGATGIERLATGDEGKGVPAKSSTVRHTRNHAVANEDALNGNVIVNDRAFVDFVAKEWRQEEVKSAAIEALHRNAPDISFDTCLVDAAAARTIAEERQALYGAHRDRLSLPVHSRYAIGLDLDSVIAVRHRRFGLAAGKLFVVVGMREDLSSKITTLDVWG